MPKTGIGAGANLDTNITTVIAQSIGGPDESHYQRLLAPLLMGAAWKVLDATVERALVDAGRVRLRGGRWTIAAKIQEAALLSSVSSLPMWSHLVALYAASVELRHSVSHRRVDVGHDLTIKGFAMDGSPPVDW